MIVKYIDSNYIIDTLKKPSWAEVEEPDFFIIQASNRVKTLIFESGAGNPDDITTYTQAQQDAIKLATSIYTFWYHDTNYDFTSGSVSVNFGGASMSESKTYNGEMVLPNVYDILRQANLIPTTETFIFDNANLKLDVDGINPDDVIKLKRQMEQQTDNNIRQDGQIVDIYDKLSKVATDEDIKDIRDNIEFIKQEQDTQNQDIKTNTENIDLNKEQIENNKNKIDLNSQNIDTLKQDLETEKTERAELATQVNKNINDIRTNTNNINTLTTDLASFKADAYEQIDNNKDAIARNRQLTQDILDGLKLLKPFNYTGNWVQGRVYNINDAVSKDNALYLSTINNNTSMPPSNDWLTLQINDINLENYFTKPEINKMVSDLNLRIDATNNKVLQVETLSNTNATGLNELRQEYNAFRDTTNAKQAEQDTNINNKANKNTTNEFTATQTVTIDAGVALILKSIAGSGKPTYIEFKNGGTRRGYVGKGSGGSNDIMLGSDGGNVVLQPAGNNGVIVSDKRIKQVANPVDATDATNKRYVDNALNGKQNTLTAGTGIEIVGNVINAIGGGGQPPFDPTNLQNQINTLKTGKMDKFNIGAGLSLTNGTLASTINTTQFVRNDINTMQTLQGALSIPRGIGTGTIDADGVANLNGGARIRGNLLLNDFYRLLNNGLLEYTGTLQPTNKALINKEYLDERLQNLPAQPPARWTPLQTFRITRGQGYNYTFEDNYEYMIAASTTNTPYRGQAQFIFRKNIIGQPALTNNYMVFHLNVIASHEQDKEWSDVYVPLVVKNANRIYFAYNDRLNQGINFTVDIAIYRRPQ